MDDELGDECTICLSSSLILNRTLDCGHSFHNDCIKKWLNNELSDAEMEAFSKREDYAINKNITRFRFIKFK